MVAPVRVRLAGNSSQASELAYTLDITDGGVKLAGLRSELTVGDIIEIQHRHERALFRVAWIHVLETRSEKHIGAECVERDRNIWATEFAAQPDEYEEKE